MAKKREKIVLNNFHPQAFLMFLASQPDNLEKSRTTPKTSPIGVHKVSDPGPARDTLTKIYNSKSRLSNSRVKANFFNLETYKISALIPEVRFFKAEGNKYTPFLFPVATDASQAARSTGNSRLQASGITSFSVNYEGTDPFTAPRMLSANLTLYVDNLANIFDKKKGYAPLADLFTISIAKAKRKRSKNATTISSGDLSRPIEIAATLGYVIPNNRMGIYTKDEIREIKESNLIIRMNVIKHNISVQQDGTATITINYVARIENAGRDRMFSAVDNPIDLLKRANVKQLLAAEKVKTDSVKKGENTDDTGSVRKQRLEKMREVRGFLDYLDSNNKIHVVEAPIKLIRIYSQLGTNPIEPSQGDVFTGGNKWTEPFQKLGNNLVQTLGPILTSTSNSFVEFTKMLNDMDFSKRKVHYVTFGDLVESFFVKHKKTLEESKKLLEKSKDIPSSAQLSNPDYDLTARNFLPELSDEEVIQLTAFSKKSQDEKNKINKTIDDAIKKMGTFRVLLSDIDFKVHAPGSTEEITLKMNIADIPVSMEAYQQFMFDKVNNSYKNTYTITDFLQDCVKDLLPSLFGVNWSAAGIAPKVISERPTFTSTTYSGADLRKSISRKNDISPDDIPGIQKKFISANISDDTDYFIISQKPDAGLTSDRSGKIDKDSRDGIYHFILGKDRGLIKSINFSRIEVQGLKEQLMTNQVGLYDELKIPYDSQIEMFGNNLFMPGSQIFINPDNIGFGSPSDPNSPAYRLGLGGYCTVISVSTNYDGQTGELSTTLGTSFSTRAGGDDSLTGIAGQVKKNMEIEKAAASNDAIPEDIPDLNTSLPQVSKGHYMTQLQNLKDPQSSVNVLDETGARNIANDYVLHQDTNAAAIPGVIDKTTNPNTGAVRYNLERGEVIEIDDSRPSKMAVKLISGRRRLTNG